MKLAVISDIHGNYKALEAFLEYIEALQEEGKGIDEILCLGDYFTDGPEPQRIMQMLKDMGEKYLTHFVLGNREEYLLNNIRISQGWKPSSASGMLNFVAQRLTPEIVEFMEGLPMTRTLQYKDLPEILICHGSPTDTRCNFMEDPGMHAQNMKSLMASYLIGGHTHRQETAQLYNKTYVNPGALGMAIDGIGGRAPFAILEGTDGQWKVQLMSIAYDLEGFLRDFEESGMAAEGYVLARATVKTLRTGVNYFFKCVVEATRKSGLPIPQVPEKVWEEAARDLGIE